MVREKLLSLTYYRLEDIAEAVRTGEIDPLTNFVKRDEALALPEWVSVEDRLPDGDADCWVVVLDRNKGSRFVHDAEFDVDESEFGWCGGDWDIAFGGPEFAVTADSCNYGMEGTDCVVTHWRHRCLPGLPPTVKEEA